MDGVTIPATCRVWLPCGSLRRERERQAVTVSPLERKKMLASVCSSRRVVPPMEPPHTAKAFPNCGQESHTLVQVLTLILKITVLTPIDKLERAARAAPGARPGTGLCVLKMK